jgi:signal peptidase II
LSAGRDKYLRLPLVTALVVIVDQLSKWWVLSAVEPHSAIPVIPGFFNLVLVHNPGGAFGFLAGHSAHWRGLFFIFFSLVAVGLILWLYKQTPPAYKWLLTGFSLILGGAFGNLIDRLRFGQVVDFLDLYVGSWHWPAFNVADSAITVGMLIFGVYLVSRKYPV